MTIDMNMSIGHWPFRKLAVTDVPGLVELMDRFAIQRGLVANLEGVLYKDIMPANEALAAQMPGYEDRIIPQGVINPAFPGWEHDLDSCVNTLNLRAIRLFPNYHGYALTDECAEKCVAAAEERGVGVSVNVRMADERMHHWHVRVPATDITPLPSLAAAHSGIPIIVNCANNGEIAQISEGILACQSLFIEISHVEGPGGVQVLADNIDINRLLYGSHAPYFYADSPRLKLQECALGDQDRQLVEYKNALRILNA